MHKRKSPEDALYKIDEACKLYEEWGCLSKVEMLRKEYGSLRRAPSNVFVESREFSLG
jgi:hypothetical protein